MKARIRAADNQQNHVIQALHHAAETYLHIVIDSNGGHTVTIHNGGGYAVYILFFLHINISAFIFRLLSDLIHPGFRLIYA